MFTTVARNDSVDDVTNGLRSPHAQWAGRCLLVAPGARPAPRSPASATVPFLAGLLTSKGVDVSRACTLALPHLSTDPTSARDPNSHHRAWASPLIDGTRVVR